MLVQWPFLSVLGFPKWASCWSPSGTWTTVAGSSYARQRASRTWRRPLRPRKSSEFHSIEKNVVSFLIRIVFSVCVCVWIQRLNSFKSSLYIALTHRTESKPELVKTEMGPPPSPASTCSDTSSIASSASLPYSMSAPLLLFLSLNPKLSQQHSSLDFPLCLSGTKPISASLCALISPLTLKQMVRRLLSARFFPLPVCLWSEYGQLTVHIAAHLVAFLPLYHMNHTASCVDN